MVSLLVCYYIAKCQEEKTISFISYHNYLTTTQIGVYQFYDELLRTFTKAYDKINIDFNVMKHRNVTTINFTEVFMEKTHWNIHLKISQNKFQPTKTPDL